MQKSISISVAVLLAACGVAATNGTNAADAQTQRPSQRPVRNFTVAASPSWAGSYRGNFDGGRGFAEITAQGGGAYRVSVQTVGQGDGQGCSGIVRGTVRPTGNVLEITTRNEFQPGICSVTLTRSGARLTVAENNCQDWHGMSCAFDGTVTRR